MADEEKELTDEQEAAEGELEGLRQEKEEFIHTLESKNAAIAELEQAVNSKDREIATLKQSIADSEQRLAEINATLVQAIASYKGLVMQTNPEIPVELLAGDTIEVINESLQNARALVDKVRQGIEAEISKTRVPAGAPQRAPLDLSVLSPREKIQYAIGGKK
jgi:chromosome segregation ATPase